MIDFKKYEDIPRDLKDAPQWVLWVKGKVNAETGKFSKLAKGIERWEEDGTYQSGTKYKKGQLKLGMGNFKKLTFDVAFDALINNKNDYEGLGFYCSNNIVGIDIDNCFEEGGWYSNLAKDIVDKLDTYTERSPSGNGLRMFVKSNNPPKEKVYDNTIGLEIFHDANFFTTVTGNVENYSDIKERTKELDEIINTYLSSKKDTNKYNLALKEYKRECVIYEGQGRDNNLASCIGHWISTGNTDYNFLMDLALGQTNIKHNPPLPINDVDRIVKSILNKSQKNIPIVDAILCENKTFTYEDFVNGTLPFEEVHRYAKDGFQLERAVTQMSKNAQSVGVRNFKKLYSEYAKNIKKQNNENANSNVTQFEGQALELETGNWTADEYGIRTDGMFGEVFACSHPILPVERLVNIDTGVEKLKIAYRKGRNWRSNIYDKKTLASNNSIIELTNHGVSVTSETSKYLVKYLQDIENLNYENIPEKNSVSRLGWIDGEGFSPYCGTLEFDGDLNFKKSFESVQEKGDIDKWIDIARKGRNKNIVTKIILAASFASVLVKPLGCLPFFVHMWGGTEVGKTVGLMLASSVWANPEVGKFIQSFNSTVVGRERMASFFNNMPLILDELQVIKDKKSFDHDIYTLCEGAGKVRGNKTGGTDQTPTWANCILSNGEMPITNASSGGGAVNRIIEIECRDNLFDDPQNVCNIIRKNHGMAGKQFIEHLQKEGVIDSINLIYKDFYSKLSENDTTQKQAISAALILTADKIVNDLFFNDTSLTADDIKGYLQTKSDVCANTRGYNYICNWISQNSNKFKDASLDVYGKFEADHVYILTNVFTMACNEGGFNEGALRSYLKDKKLIECSDGRHTKKTRINGITAWCVCLRIEDNYF